MVRLHPEGDINRVLRYETARGCVGVADVGRCCRGLSLEIQQLGAPVRDDGRWRKHCRYKKAWQGHFSKMRQMSDPVGYDWRRRERADEGRLGKDSPERSIDRVGGKETAKGGVSVTEIWRRAKGSPKSCTKWVIQ